ncbi:MAG: AI-2E family transporter [Akkermansiaceae bacterium]|nr:AI-2E family transporter [Akkermansiaceae bacterium]
MMPEGRKAHSTRILVAAASTIVIIGGLKLAQGFFVPILLAVFIATVSFPITNWLRRRKVPRFFAVLLTVLVDFAFLTGIVVIVISLMGDLEDKWQTKYFPAVNERIEEISLTAVGLLENWQVKDAEGLVRQYTNVEIPQKLGANLDVFGVGANVAWGLISFLGTTLLVLILTVFMLSEARMFGRRKNAILEARGPNFDRFMNSSADIQRYLAMKTVVSLATGLLAGFLCWAAGLDFFVLWGIVAFTMNFIPVLGSIIAGIPPVILAFLVNDAASALAVGIGYISINIFLGNFLEPMLMGRRFGLSTLVVIISVLFWGWIWGPVGMLLAVPLTMVVKVMLENSNELRWISVAITKEKRRRILSSDDDEDLEDHLLEESLEISPPFSETSKS